MTGAPTDTLPKFLDAIERAFMSRRWTFLDEEDLHRKTLAVLPPPWADEWYFGKGVGRVDFFHEERGVAVELKHDGSPSAVAEQLLRYADHATVHAVVLVTTKARLGAGLPPTLRGKPLRVVALWRAVAF